MDIVISFDTEDFLSETTPDAQKWWAEELTTRGITGTFNMVGEMIRKLNRVGRQDTLDAIAKHHIGWHTNYHSVHPTHPEAVEALSLEDGIRWMLKNDVSGFKDVFETFERVPISYITAGWSWTPATLLAMAQTGVKVNHGGIDGRGPFHPYWYCGLLTFRYGMNFETMFELESEESWFQERFKKLAAEVGEEGVLIVYTHPGRICTAKHWDIAYARGKNPPIAEASSPPQWPAGHSEKLKGRVQRMFDWMAKFPGAQFSDIATVYTKYSKNPYTLDVLLDEAGLKPGEAGKLPMRKREPDDFIPHDDFPHPPYSSWIPHKEDFDPVNVYKQMKGLAWTIRKAERNG